MQHKWFKHWFNSPFYHILYQKRDHKEAEFFIDRLTQFLKPSDESRILDIACGKGRHAIYLNEKGYDVTGIDLSEQSIQHAKTYENDRLHFFVHDMRKLFYINYFDIALNLFTSFGYFDTEKDHVNALKTFSKSLKAEGILVIDFFNSNKVIENLIPNESKTLNHIQFNISKKLEEGKIIKDINFEHQNNVYHFQEKVKAFSLADFERILSKANLSIQHKFGNYALEEFDVQNSDRLILICKKS